jgi:hypothetical protein
MEVEGDMEEEAGMEEDMEEEGLVELEVHTRVAMEVGTPAGRCSDPEAKWDRLPETDDPSTSQVTDLDINRKLGTIKSEEWPDQALRSRDQLQKLPCEERDRMYHNPMTRTTRWKPPFVSRIMNSLNLRTCSEKTRLKTWIMT